MEKFIIGGNGTGKTRKMLEEAKKSGAIVVCKYPLHMQNKANSYGIYGLKFASYDEMDMGAIDEKKIAIDELGQYFEHCFGVELDAFTMTIE